MPVSSVPAARGRNLRMATRLDIHNSEIPVLCRSCEARHRGICGVLDADQLVTLSKTSSKHSVHAGAELVGDAETIDHYSNVLSGVVKLTKTLPDGRQQIVGLQFAPDFLGRPFRRESVINVEATTDVALCSFPKATMDKLIRDIAGSGAPPAAADAERAGRGARLDGHARAQDRIREGGELPADDRPSHRSGAWIPMLARRASTCR